jgi:hypothetical protein
VRAVLLLLAFATPAVADPAPHMFASFVGQPAHVKVAWPTAPAAPKYRARWSGEDVPLSVPVFERDETTPGHYDLSIAALDASGKETDTADIPVDIVEVRAVPPGGDEPKISSAFALGATFSAPGLRCRFAGAMADETRASSIGTQTLTCGDDHHEVAVPVIIAPVVVSAKLPPLARGATTIVHITVASVAPVGDRLDVVATGDITLGAVQRTEVGLDVPVDVPVTARTASLTVEAGGVALGHVDVELGAVQEPPPPPPAGWFALDVGGQLGAFIPPGQQRGASVVGHPTSAAGTLTSGVLAGGRIGLFPIPRVGVEVEVGVATTGFAGQSGTAAVAVARAQLAARVAEVDHYGLRLLAGVDVLDVLTDLGASHAGSEGAIHLGAAFSVEARPDTWVRFEALDVITAAQDASFAHCFELQVGVVTRLGRRDRW